MASEGSASGASTPSSKEDMDCMLHRISSMDAIVLSIWLARLMTKPLSSSTCEPWHVRKAVCSFTETG